VGSGRVTKTPQLQKKTNEQTNRQGNICNKLMKVNLIASNRPSKIQMELPMLNSGLDIFPGEKISSETGQL